MEKTLLKSDGEWMLIDELVQNKHVIVKDIHAVWKLASMNQDISVSSKYGVMYVRFCGGDGGGDILEDDEHLGRHQHVILDALHYWVEQEHPPIFLDEIANRNTGNTWLHYLAAKGFDKPIFKTLTCDTPPNFLVVNKFGQTPADVAKTTKLCSFLDTQGLIGISKRKDVLEKRVEFLMQDIGSAKKELDDIKEIFSSLKGCWLVPTRLYWQYIVSAWYISMCICFLAVVMVSVL